VLESDNWQRQEQLYAIIQNDVDGYAEITEVSRIRPTDMEDYIVSTGYFGWNEERRKINTTLLNVNFPFNYYFLENTPIERVKNFYDEYVRYSNKTIYAVVNVDKGKCALKDLQVEGTSVKDLVKSE
jgi:methyltransferase-like protein